MPQRNAQRVSPTAYATGNFWVRHGMSHPALWTPQGAWLDRGFSAFIRATRLASGVSLEALMVARHVGIDACLEAAIADGRVTQVIELAAGLSGRGIRFAQRHGARLTYVETDLPDMAALKHARLETAGLLTEQHRVVTLDALAEDGAASLAGVAAKLDPQQGTAIITEGLVNYLPPAAAQALWRRIAGVLGDFVHGLYLSDFYLTGENRNAAMLAFGAAISTFVGGRLHVPFDTEAQARTAFIDDGFATVDLHRTADLAATRHLAHAAGADRVRILEVWMAPRQPQRRAPPRRRKPATSPRD